MRADPEAIAHYAVIGHPARHSLSPRMHAMFARLTGQALAYRAIDLPPAAFEAFWETQAGRRLDGANITLPFKERAARLVDQTSTRAAAAGAVNTVTRRDDRLLGDNTDGYGLLRDLEENLRWPLAGPILVLGAGGAARGVVAALVERGAAELTIVNRTVARAEQLAERFPGLVVRSTADPGGGYLGIVNATSTGHRGERPELPNEVIAGDPWCYDLSYGTAAAPFLRWCGAQGASRRADGLGMLVEQGAESFRSWRGVRPPTSEVMAALRG